MDMKCPKCEERIYVVKSFGGTLPNWLYCPKCDNMLKAKIEFL